MQNGPEKVSYWIQRADFTSTDFDPVNLTEALAFCAWQADDGTLRKMADRIQARAVRRCVGSCSAASG